MRSCRIITGELGEGKTTLIGHIASTVLSPVGFISIHRGDEYFMENLETGEEKLLMTRENVFASKWKNWYVDFSLFDSVMERMKSVHSGPVFLDECGRMEIEGKGYAPVISLLKNRDVDLYITLRRPFVEDFVRAFSIVDYSLVPVERRADFT